MLVAQSHPNLWTAARQDSSLHGILQARILEWVAISSPGDFPNPGIEPRCPVLQADSLPSEPPIEPKRTPPSGANHPSLSLETRKAGY